MDGLVRLKVYKIAINFYTNIDKLLNLSQPDFIKVLETECKQEEAFRYFSWTDIRLHCEMQRLSFVFITYIKPFHV